MEVVKTKSAYHVPHLKQLHEEREKLIDSYRMLEDAQIDFNVNLDGALLMCSTLE